MSLRTWPRYWAGSEAGWAATGRAASASANAAIARKGAMVMGAVLIAGALRRRRGAMRGPTSVARSARGQAHFADGAGLPCTKMPPMFTRRSLDQVVLDVEFVLISVVQGVALTTLAVMAAPMLHAPSVVTLAFLGTGFLFVLSFWAVAIIHALSFVIWPMDLGH